MSQDSSQLERWLLGFLAVVAVLAGLAAVVMVLMVAPLPGHAQVQQLVSQLFALNTVQTFWYVTRAAGLMAYLLLWLATAWGIAVSSKIFDPVLNRYFTYDFHQFLSLLALGFVALHVVVLLFDKFLPYSVAQILLPFISPYRPIWVGVGVIALYLSLLVSVTFYLRNRIGPDNFRTIHYASYIAFVGAVLHGWLSGSDTPLLITQIMYAGTTLAVVFLTIYRLLMTLWSKEEPKTKQPIKRQVR